MPAGQERVVVAFESIEDRALIVVGSGRVGGGADGLLVGLEFIEGVTLLQPIIFCLGRDQQVFDDPADLFDHIVKGFIAAKSTRDWSGIHRVTYLVYPCRRSENVLLHCVCSFREKQGDLSIASSDRNLRDYWQ